MPSEQPAVSVGAKLKEIREGKGLTLRQVQEATGISGGHLSLIENGKVTAPSPSVLQRLADFYAYDPHDLLVLAGYLSPGDRSARNEAAHGIALAQIKDLDEEDIQKLSAFIRFLRSEKKSTRRGP